MGGGKEMVDWRNRSCDFLYVQKYILTPVHPIMVHQAAESKSEVLGEN